MFLDHHFPYLFRRVVAIEVENEGVCELRHYAELGSYEERLINAWLTPMMVKESKKYQLGTENIYIAPLRKRISCENKRKYETFEIVRGAELT